VKIGQYLANMDKSIVSPFFDSRCIFAFLRHVDKTMFLALNCQLR